MTLVVVEQVDGDGDGGGGDGVRGEPVEEEEVLDDAQDDAGEMAASALLTGCRIQMAT